MQGFQSEFEGDMMNQAGTLLWLSLMGSKFIIFAQYSTSYRRKSKECDKAFDYDPTGYELDSPEGCFVASICYSPSSPQLPIFS